ncbi:MAG: aminopeptidase P N-terminal domain-containing protein [Pseudomonadota bacterium]|nr:aminopeptidase P N-terminal domain-containing protein [Pseudomonadota bacterium]
MNSCFQKRRECLASLLKLDEDIFILQSGRLSKRNGDVNFPFRQNSNFYYLTGFNEPESILLLKKSAGTLNSIIFCREKDSSFERWNGHVLGPKEAMKALNLTLAFDIKEFTKVFLDNLSGVRHIHMLCDEQEDLQSYLKNIMNDNYPLLLNNFVDAANTLHNMRLFKDKTEITLIEKAADISCGAHLNAICHTRPGILESDIEGKLLSHFMQYGCRQVAYESIVASGKNACILHYVKNLSTLKKGDLLLIDAGVEFENYAADITRTFPISGKFSLEQRLIYEVVLATQLVVIESIKPGVSWSDIQKISELEIIKGLVSLGLLSGSPKSILQSQEHKQFYMHGFGHWLGLDVHDVGTYKNKDGSSILLEPGMVLTVEPGIYISRDLNDVASKWRNIGVRIEDDILVTATGARILTKKLPKSINDLENLVGSAYA